MIAQTVPELTNYDYNELYYNSAGTLIAGNFMYEVCDLISKCGINIAVTNTYDYSICNAIMQFQEIAGLTPTGILTTNTLQAMILYSSKLSDIIEGNGIEEDNEETIENDSPHYNSFFKEDNLKLHRQNRKDIKIVFGSNSITKTIKDVFMRSVSVEVDTSGNPISEVYEFIARDVQESDEITDINKYRDDEPATSADVPYDFSSIRG